jgi:hypothetical protein
MHLKRIHPGLYESPDGRYEVSHEITWLDGECECAICQGYIFGTCPNDGCAKREGWHIWDKAEDNYASFAPEPQQFERFRDARRALLEELAPNAVALREP